MNPDPGTSTIGSLLSQLRDESSALLRQEVALAKAELGEKVTTAGHNVITLATGGAVAYAGALILLFGVGQLAGQGLVAAGLSVNIAYWLGFVLVGALVGIIGWTMFTKAKKSLSPENLTPRQTLDSLKDNQRWAKNKISSSHEPAR